MPVTVCGTAQSKDAHCKRLQEVAVHIVVFMCGSGSVSNLQNTWKHRLTLTSKHGSQNHNCDEVDAARFLALVWIKGKEFAMTRDTLSMKPKEVQVMHKLIGMLHFLVKWLVGDRVQCVAKNLMQVWTVFRALIGKNIPVGRDLTN